jgi:hypothetical protein
MCLARSRHVGCTFGPAMRRTWRTALVVLGVLAVRTARAERANGIYVEAFGKGGLWGLGYDHRLGRRISIGAVGSGQSFEGERYVSLSPYLGLYLARYGRSAWFTDVGAQIAHVWSASPVPEWSGESSTGVGGILSTGYEFRGRILVRLFVHGVFGKGGALPWAGAGFGWAF